MGAHPLVAVYVVTYRRPHLLIRALRSLIAQTNGDWAAWVVNDDPEDQRVREVIQTLGDGRIKLFAPAGRRGGTANFNLAFQEKNAAYAAILEDDNWWEPDFIKQMADALSRHPGCEIACANERIWRELADGNWENTGATIWSQTTGESEWRTPMIDALGSAKLCNSSMFFKTANARAWQTPDDIPVDVTEHFRERCIPQPLLLVHEPLVNFASTIASHRSGKGSLWGDYQCLLIGSCFQSLEPGARVEFAKLVWRQTGTQPCPRATTLLMAAWAVPAARCLWPASSLKQRLRFIATVIRRWGSFTAALSARRRRSAHWNFLIQSPFNQKLAAGGRP